MDNPLGPTDWQFVTLQLPVPDVREARTYDRDVLGFKVAWVYEEECGAVYHGATEVFFSREEGEIRPPPWNFVHVENAAALLAIYRERDVTIIEEIESHPRGMREFTIEDNSGHRFRIGHSEGPVVTSTVASSGRGPRKGGSREGRG
ncbi:MAG: hypothetical protein GY910_06160 [bacterium]|nr:hypothetical protein [bacterium]